MRGDKHSFISHLLSMAWVGCQECTGEHCLPSREFSSVGGDRCKGKMVLEVSSGFCAVTEGRELCLGEEQGRLLRGGVLGVG